MATPWHPPALELRPLQGDERADVCVVGAGLAGILLAHRLLETGRSVIVLDQSGVGAGESGRTTAHLTAVLDHGYHELSAIHGPDRARLFVQSHTAAIRYLEEVARREHIDCDLRRIDAFEYHSSDRDAQRAHAQLEREQRAATAAGLSCTLVERAPLPHSNGPALRFADQADFDPTRFLGGVAAAVLARGGRIHAPARVVRIEDGSTVRVHTTGGQVVVAKQVIVATHTPINDQVVMHTKQAPYRTYAIGARIAADALAPALYWDLEDPYHYVRTTRSDDGSTLLIVGGEDHKVGQDDHTERRWAKLERWLREHFPMAEPERRWSGQVLEPNDGAAFIGRNPGDQNVYIATGFSGNGMTYSAIAALLIVDLIEELHDPWWEAYDPERKPLAARAVLDFAKENLNVAARYAEWLSSGDVSSVEQIGRGQGAIVRSGVHKLAVYVDEQGRAHSCNAKCPHLGCVVTWNGAEKSWDCPCHGSRFDRYGRLLVGPALQDLEPAPAQAQTPSAHVLR